MQLAPLSLFLFTTQIEFNSEQSMRPRSSSVHREARHVLHFVYL
jgi:hypothetical protein